MIYSAFLLFKKTMPIVGFMEEFISCFLLSGKFTSHGVGHWFWSFSYYLCSFILTVGFSFIGIITVDMSFKILIVFGSVWPLDVYLTLNNSIIFTSLATHCYLHTSKHYAPCINDESYKSFRLRNLESLCLYESESISNSKSAKEKYQYCFTKIMVKKKKKTNSLEKKITQMITQRAWPSVTTVTFSQESALSPAGDW